MDRILSNISTMYCTHVGNKSTMTPDDTFHYLYYNAGRVKGRKGCVFTLRLPAWRRHTGDVNTAGEREEGGVTHDTHQ